MSKAIAVQLIDDSCIDYKIQAAVKAVQKAAPDSLKKGFVTYAEVAARQMPPPKQGKKSRSIPAKLYKRQILSIDEMYKKTTEKRFKNALIHKKIQGFKYAVAVYEKRGKKKTLYFGKTERELKAKYGRIRFRGLYKWLWGAGLQSLGVKSTMFDNLLKKSPDMAKKRNLAAVFMNTAKEQTQIVAHYQAQGIDYFANKGKRDAKSAMLRKMKKLLQSRVNEEIKKI